MQMAGAEAGMISGKNGILAWKKGGESGWKKRGA